MRADRLAAHVDKSAWKECSAGDRSKGPRVYDWANVRQPARGGLRAGLVPVETLASDVRLQR